MEMTLGKHYIRTDRQLRLLRFSVLFDYGIVFRLHECESIKMTPISNNSTLDEDKKNTLKQIRTSPIRFF